MTEENRKERREGVEELGDLPDTVEDIKKNPVLKPLLDFNKAAILLDKEDDSEANYLTQKMEILKKVLDTGIYQDSHIARTYNDVLEVYKRILFIFSRYSNLADTKMGEIKKIVKKYYITKEEHEEKVKELNKPITKPVKEIPGRKTIEELEEIGDLAE